MPRRRLIRRALLIVSICTAILALAAAGVYIASIRYAFFLQTRHVSIEVMAGVVEVRHGGAPSSSITLHNWPLRHGTKISLAGHDWLVRLPMLYLTAFFAAAALLTGGPAIRRRFRPIPKGHCPRCRYDLRGLPPESSCPECGAPATPQR